MGGEEREMGECFICLEEGGKAFGCDCKICAHSSCILKLCEERKDVVCTVCKTELKNLVSEAVFDDTRKTWFSFVLTAFTFLTAARDWYLFYTHKEVLFLYLAFMMSILTAVLLR